MSLLARLAKQASRLLRRRARSAGERMRSRAGNGRTPPPVPPIGLSTDDDDDDYDDIGRFGRDITYLGQDYWQKFSAQMRRVESSNVWAYGYEPETDRMGILYVTFLDYVPKGAGGDGQKKNAPGPTYAYYDFPLRKFQAFEKMAESSAGSAVWDYCRVRHSVWEHQHRYRLVSVSGNYIPRKATQRGFAARRLLGVGEGSERGTARRSTLPPRKFATSRVLPNRAAPNRGRPNRGRPNRG